MKKLVLLLISLWVLSSNGQEIRGGLIWINKCEMLDSGGYKIIKTTPVRMTFAKLNQNQFQISGDNLRVTYNLYDKQVDSSDKTDWVVHFLSNSYRRQSVIAVRECEGNIKVAVFSMDGRTKFTEYIIKPRNPKKK